MVYVHMTPVDPDLITITMMEVLALEMVKRVNSLMDTTELSDEQIATALCGTIEGWLEEHNIAYEPLPARNDDDTPF